MPDLVGYLEGLYQELAHHKQYGNDKRVAEVQAEIDRVKPAEPEVAPVTEEAPAVADAPPVLGTATAPPSEVR